MIGSFIIGGVITMIYVLTYPLYCVGLFQLAKRKQMALSWLAFVPKLNHYILGSIVGDFPLLGRKCTFLPYLLPFLSLFSLLPIPLVGKISNLIFLLLYWVTIHRLYEIYAPSNADIYLILGIISQCLTPIFVFRLRNKKKTFSKLIIDDDADGIYDREIEITDAGEERIQKYKNPNQII